MEKRYTRAYEVAIGTKSTTVHTENKSAAIDRAVEKLYGPRCFWFSDSGLPGYGQVFEALQPTKYNSNPGNSSRTARVSIDVAPIGTPSRNYLKQLESDRQAKIEVNKIIDQEMQAENSGFNAAISGKTKPIDAEYQHLVDYGYERGLDCVDDQRRQAEHEEKQLQQEKEELQKIIDGKDQRIDAENEARSIKHHVAVMAEVERIRSIDLSVPITDNILAAIVRNTIATATFPHGLPLGEYKRKMLNGEYPDTVREYLQSDRLYNRLENVIWTE